jgi:hypothetical protein
MHVHGYESEFEYGSEFMSMYGYESEYGWTEFEYDMNLHGYKSEYGSEFEYGSDMYVHGICIWIWKHGSEFVYDLHGYKSKYES